MPEPWLRGPLAGVDPSLAPVLRALEQAREDLEKYCGELSDEEIWLQPFGVASVGFHLRHIAGSLDRLSTYLQEGALSAEQFAFLESESAGGGKRVELLKLVCEATERASRIVAALDTSLLTSPRHVGRQQLPTTVIGLAIHLAEHTQRHVGQAITACQLIAAIRPKALPNHS